MPARRMIVARGAGGTHTRPEHRKADADDFGGERDALRRKTVSVGRKILNVLTHSVVRPVWPKNGAGGIASPPELNVSERLPNQAFRRMGSPCKT